MPGLMRDREELAMARRLGELEGAAFEAALAAKERALRSDRLSQIALCSDAADAPLPANVSVPRHLAETESRIRELAQFHQAVTGSKSWKILQRLRGIVGRAW